MKEVMNSSALAKTSPSLVDGAYDWLLDEITNFRLTVGVSLTEAKVAAKLGISRTPIREALQRLEQQGLLRRTSAARFTVTAPSAKEVNDSCDVLQVLDLLSYKRAATNVSSEQAERLILLGEQMVAASLEGSSEQWTLVDAQFHEMIQNLSDNELIRSISIQIRRRVHRFWLRSASHHSRLNSCSEEHLELARAVQRRDLVAIELAVNDHINHMRKSVLDLVSQLESFVGDEFVGSSIQG